MEMQLEPPSAPRLPLVRLPRNTNSLGVVDIFVEVARGVAGCVICTRPIPKGMSRLSLKVRLSEPIALPDGRQRHFETYYLHVGCITDRIRPEVVRIGTDCWDCGLPAKEGSRHDRRCFTSSRFSCAPLCSTCGEKRRWCQCRTCWVYYPAHMVSTAVKGNESDSIDLFDDRSIRYHAGDAVCPSCAERFAIPTVAKQREHELEVARQREEWANRKRQMVERGML